MHPAFNAREVGLFVRAATGFGMTTQETVQVARECIRTVTLVKDGTACVWADYLPNGDLLCVKFAFADCAVTMWRLDHGENLFDVAMSRLELKFRTSASRLEPSEEPVHA